MERCDVSLGLSPITLANYTRVGYSDLVRGQDYFVRSWQRGPYNRRKLFFTEQGIAGSRCETIGSFGQALYQCLSNYSSVGMDATVHLPRREDP